MSFRLADGLEDFADIVLAIVITQVIALPRTSVCLHTSKVPVPFAVRLSVNNMRDIRFGHDAMLEHTFSDQELWRQCRNSSFGGMS